MKFIINFLMCVSLSTPLYASKLILITHHDQHEEAHHIRTVLIETYSIPEDFIQVDDANDACEKKMKSAKWHLCIDDQGDLSEVSTDQQFLKETLKVFLKG